MLEVRYHVALSAAHSVSKESDYVAEVFRRLRFRRLNVYRAPDEIGRSWGRDRLELADRVFRFESLLNVVFLSPAYMTDRWCQLEKDMILARAIEDNFESIVVGRFHNAHLLGLPPPVPILDLRVTPAPGLAAAIAEKLKAPTHGDGNDLSETSGPPRDNEVLSDYLQRLFSARSSWKQSD